MSESNQKPEDQLEGGSPPHPTNTILFKRMGDGEYFLMLEEILRSCTPVDFGIANVEKIIQTIPAIVLNKPINKYKYINSNFTTSWMIPQNYGKIDTLFLNIEFNNIETIIVHIDVHDHIKWLRALILSQGDFVLTDKHNSIYISGVYIDIIKTIVQLLRLTPDYKG